MFRTNTRHNRQRRRSSMQLREPGPITPFAIVGFAVVAVLAVLVLGAYARLVVVNDQAVELRGQLSALQVEEAKLETQYELAYDLQSIENQVLSSGAMIKQQASQVTTISLAEPDSVEYYQDTSLLHAIVDGVKGMISAIVAYF